MKKTNVGRAILGFLISFFMVCLLIGAGLLIGVKTTILKGSDVMDILENANTFGMISELFTSELEATMRDEPMMQEVVATIFSEDVLTEMTSDMTQAIVSGEDVDLSGVAEECLSTLESTSDKMIDQVFEEVTPNGEINVSALAQSEILKSYEQQFGMEITPWIEEYVSSTYGDTTIKVDEAELESVKSEAKAALKDEIMPALEDAVEVYIADVNLAVNQELQAMNQEYRISEIIQMIEGIMDMIQIAILILILFVVILSVAELALVYRNAKNRGLRNIGVSAIIAGLVIALVGAVTSVANSFLVGVVGMTGLNQDAITDILMNFIEANLSKLGIGFLLIAVLYFMGAIVCLIFSSRMYKAQKNLI